MADCWRADPVAEQAGSDWKDSTEFTLTLTLR